jgi:hypothetical protein
MFLLFVQVQSFQIDRKCISISNQQGNQIVVIDMYYAQRLSQHNDKVRSDPKIKIISLNAISIFDTEKISS